jgi:hypothetical protein
MGRLLSDMPTMGARPRWWVLPREERVDADPGQPSHAER